MTHEDQYRQMLNEATISLVDQPNSRMSDGKHDVTISLRESRPVVGGYEKYYVRHVFNVDGSLHRIEVFY